MTDDWTQLGRLSWRPLHPFGAEIDADLSCLFSAEDVEAFLHLYHRHGLLIARGQRLDRPAQQRLLSCIGPILERAGESGYISTDNGAASLSELRFHADGAYTDHPLEALSLHAVDVVDGASSIRFVSAERAFAAMPEDLRREVEGLSVHMISPTFEILGQRSCDLRDPPFMQKSVKPLLHRHARSGAIGLWASEMHAAAIENMDWEEGRDLLHRLFDLLYADDAMFVHHWHRGDLVIWDNIRFQHARGPLADVGRRVLQRVIVGTEGAAPHIRAA